MKKVAALFLALGSTIAGWGQIQHPVHFDYSVIKTGAATYAVHFTATMNEGWHIYAQAQPEEAIAVPTAIAFNKNPLITLKGKPREEGTKEKYEDKTAGIIQYQYGHKLDLIQIITVRGGIKTTISGNITYQACTDEMCLPPKTIPFTIDVL